MKKRGRIDRTVALNLRADAVRPHLLALPGAAQEICDHHSWMIADASFDPETDRDLRAAARRKAQPAYRIAQAARKLIDAIDAAPPDWDLGSLSDRPGDDDVLLWLDHALRAAELHALPLVRRPSAKPVKVRAQGVAIKCVVAFSDITGKMPTMAVRGGKSYGPFLDLVTSVFAALDIAASPEGQARHALKAARQTMEIAPSETV